MNFVGGQRARWATRRTICVPMTRAPDDAVHGEEGVLVLFDSRVSDGRTLPSQSILDVMPTLLSILGEPIPGYVQGRPNRRGSTPPAVGGGSLLRWAPWA